MPRVAESALSMPMARLPDPATEPLNDADWTLSTFMSPDPATEAPLISGRVTVITTGS